jgi:hypothetical protein
MAVRWLSGKVRRGAAAAVAAGLAVAAAPAAVASAATAPAKHVAPALPKVRAAQGVGVLREHQQRVRNDAASVFRPTSTTWPSAQTVVTSTAAPVTPLLQPGASWVSVALSPNSAAGLTAVPGGPLLVGRAELRGGPSSVRMAVLGHRAAVAAGVRGVMFTVRAAAGGSGRVRVGLSYAGFSQVSGGNYGLGLGLEVLPACALTTPSRPACERGRPLPSVNDAATRTVSAVVSLAGARSVRHASSIKTTEGGILVVAAVDSFSDGGDAGTYFATSLKPSGTWTAGGSDGTFTYSYPMTVPPAGLMGRGWLDDSRVVHRADVRPLPGRSGRLGGTRLDRGLVLRRPGPDLVAERLIDAAGVPGPVQLHGQQHVHRCERQR